MVLAFRFGEALTPADSVLFRTGKFRKMLRTGKSMRKWRAERRAQRAS